MLLLTINFKEKEKMKTKRKFGVEIETTNINDREILSVFRSLRIPCDYQDEDRCNCGECAEDGSNSKQKTWEIHIDGSIHHSNGGGWEIVSPPLYGNKGIKQIDRVVKALRKAGASANSSCGLHVHVDAGDLQSIDLANIVLRYSKFEDKIDNLMPKSRQKNNNTYCRSVKSIAQKISKRKINTLSSMEPFEFVDKISGGDRYKKINIEAYIAHGTVEFRQHFGTVDEKNITNWIQFCVNFVEQSKLTKNKQYKRIPIDVYDFISELKRSKGIEQYYIEGDYGKNIIYKSRKHGFNIKYNRKSKVYTLFSKPKKEISNIKKFPKQKNDSFTSGLDKQTADFYIKNKLISPNASKLNDEDYDNDWCEDDY